MSKTFFDEVIGTPPPSTVDVPAIVRRRRRISTLRRVGIMATSVVAMSAMVAAGLSLAPGRGGRGQSGPAAPSLILIVPFGTLSPDVTPHDVADALKQAVATVAEDAAEAHDAREHGLARRVAHHQRAAAVAGAGIRASETAGQGGNHA